MKLGMDPAPGLFAADVAKAYVASVEGFQQGAIQTRTSLFRHWRVLHRPATDLIDGSSEAHKGCSLILTITVLSA